MDEKKFMGAFTKSQIGFYRFRLIAGGHSHTDEFSSIYDTIEFCVLTNKK